MCLDEGVAKKPQDYRAVLTIFLSVQTRSPDHRAGKPRIPAWILTHALRSKKPRSPYKSTVTLPCCSGGRSCKFTTREILRNKWKKGLIFIERCAQVNITSCHYKTSIVEYVHMIHVIRHDKSILK